VATGAPISTTPRRPAFLGGIAASVAAALAAALLTGACRSSTDDGPPPLEPSERALFFGPLPGEGVPIDRRVDELLTDVLDGCSKEEYRLLMQELVNLGEPAVPVLGERLLSRMDEDSTSVRGAYAIDNIAEVLGRIESPRAEPYLLRALEHEVEFVRVKALQSLAPIATEAAVPALARLSGDEPAKVRETAVQGLLRIGSQEAQAVLLERMEDFRPGLRLDAMERLAELGNPAIAPIAREIAATGSPSFRLSAAKCLLDLGIADGFEPLERAVESGDPVERMRAVEILALRSEPRAVAAIERVARDPDTEPALLRVIAIGMRATGKGDRDILMALRAHEVSAVRSEAYRSLAERDPAFALDLFASDMAAEEDPLVRRDILRSIRHADDPRATELLMERFDAAPNAEEAKYVLTGLQKNLDPAAVPLFVRVLLEDDRRVDGGKRPLSEVASVYLPIFMEDAVTALERAYDPDDAIDRRRRVVEALGRVPHRAVLPGLGRIYEREADPALRLQILTRAREVRRDAAFLRDEPVEPPG